ncbi:MAG TPA: hypothetical protein VMT62_15195 [Syntrophorhabdaceae bacterium]|nr:hypothetical protein [Syntrophorhabdaceae bacterium]
MEFDTGDFLKYYDGRLCKVLEKCDPVTKTTVLQFIDRDEPSWMEVDKAFVETNLGASREVSASFYSARGIHLRLNRMKGI